MKILAVGDVTGSIGCLFLARHLRALKKLKGIDLCIVNGENSADSNGITPESAEKIFLAGADIITTGNHAFKRREAYQYFDECEYLIRPYNFPDSNPGRGAVIWDNGKTRVLVANFSGMTYMNHVRNPFEAASKLLSEIKNKDCITVFDFHAEATSEKQAFAYFLDGKISVLYGTHTHVQTADERILSGGLGYITDLGMTGPIESVLGIPTEDAISLFTTAMPGRYRVADGECELSGAIFEIDEKTKRCIAVERVNIR